MEFSQPLAVRESPIDGLKVFTLPVHGDSRGWFKENWQRDKQVALGLDDFGPVQNNISFNAEAGVTRGLHAEPWDKYVSVATGSVFGAWCDLRAGSPTFGAVFTCTITPDVAVYVPRGVANGFQALEPTAYTYLVNDHWSPTAHYSCVNLADPALGIDWPIPLDQAEFSAKDLHHPMLDAVQPVPPRKVLITGAGGQLGRALVTHFPDAELATHRDFDLTRDITNARNWHDYDTIINAAAYTLVDQAEGDRATAWAVNAVGVGKLARVAAANRITLVHVSTDYVFDGTATMHTEDERPSPLNVYGQSKAAGDIAAASVPRHYIVRTSWVVGDGGNFVRTMAGLAAGGGSPTVVNDQYGRPTFADDLAAGIAHLLSTKARFGTYNLSNEGEVISFAQLARETFALLGHDPARVKQTTTEDFFATRRHAAPRPTNSTFTLDKLRATGFIPRNWRDALADYLDTYAAAYRAPGRGGQQ